MVNFRDHAANFGRVRMLNYLLHPAKAEAANRLPHVAPRQPMKLTTHFSSTLPFSFLSSP